MLACLGLCLVAVDARRRSHVQPLVGADDCVVMDLHEPRLLGRRASSSSRAMCLVAHNQIETTEACLLCGCDHVDRLVRREDHAHSCRFGASLDLIEQALDVRGRGNLEVVGRHVLVASNRSDQIGSIRRNASQKSSNRFPFAACVFADCSKNSRSCLNVVIVLPLRRQCHGAELTFSAIGSGRRSGWPLPRMTSIEPVGCRPRGGRPFGRRATVATMASMRSMPVWTGGHSRKALFGREELGPRRSSWRAAVAVVAGSEQEPHQPAQSIRVEDAQATCRSGRTSR